jgi:GT2 family glycosyltransferase
MNVSIIIPNWNGKDLLEKNLGFVLKAKKNKKNKILEVIVVDDGSTDDSVRFLEKNFKGRIKIIRHKVNRGFASAVNTGVRMAGSPLVCLLNTDVIPSENFLVDVLPHFLDAKVFAVSLHEEGYGYAVGKFEDGFIVHAPGKQKKKVVKTFWVNGGSGVFRRDIWMSLKGMDEKLFSPFYWEDTDICYRALKRGYQLLWEPNAHVVHQHESTISTNNFKKKKLDLIKERNQLLFIWKNLTSPMLMKRHVVGLSKRLMRHPGYIKVFLAALFKIGLVKKLRNKEKKETKVSDEAIFASFSS